MFFKKAIALLQRKRYALSMLLTNVKDKIKMRVFTPKKQQPNYRANRRPHVPWHERHDIIGIALIAFVISCTYATIAVWFNISTVGIVPKIMVLPQAVVGAGIVVWKFTKK